MNVTQVANVILSLAILLSSWSSLASAISLSAVSAQKDELYNGQITKTHCNCSLVAAKTENFLQADAIAISFVVSVKKANSTSMGEDFSFVWVRKVRAKFLLSLPDDSEILSLTTLQHSVIVQRIDMSPVNNSNCFHSLTPLCKAEVIVDAFYKSGFNAAAGQPFCFPPLEQKNQSKDNEIVRRCCSRGIDTEYINCTETIDLNTWVAYAIVAVQVGSAIMFILCPLLFKYLPTRDTQIARRSRGAAQRRFGYSSIPPLSVDATTSNRKLLTLVEPLSFATCGGDEAQACYSRLCRAIILFIFPIIFCVYVVFFFVNNHATKIRTNVTYYTGLVGLLKPPVEYYVFSIVFFCMLVLVVLVLIPGRLSGIGKALSGRKDEKTFLGFEKPEQFINNHSGKIGFQFLYSNMVFHLKCCLDFTFWLFILQIIFAPCTRLLKSCCIESLDDETESSSNSEQNHTQRPPVFCIVLVVIFLPVILTLWMCFVTFALLVYVTPVGYVAFRICCLLYNKDVPFKSECCEGLPLCIRFILILVLYLVFILCCVFVLCSYIFVTFMFGVFFYILGKIFLYTLIGLGFNVNFYIPYTVAGFFVLFYIWRAFKHYFSVYENLRIVLFEECEKYEQQAALNGQINVADNPDSPPQKLGTGLLLLLDYNNNPSLPVNLYVTTYRRLRPRGKTFFTILAKLFLTFVYLSVAFASIMSLNKTQDTSTYVQAGFLCVTFALPLLLSYGNTSHSKQRRKELEYQVRFIIHRYVSKVAANIPNNEVASGNSVDLSPNNDLFEI